MTVATKNSYFVSNGVHIRPQKGDLPWKEVRIPTYTHKFMFSLCEAMWIWFKWLCLCLWLRSAELATCVNSHARNQLLFFLYHSSNVFSFKGTLWRRLSHGHFSFTAKYISNWHQCHQLHLQLLHLREQGPIFVMMRGNLIHALVESWKFDPVINSDAPGLWIMFLHSPITHVWIYATQSSQIWSY